MDNSQLQTQQFLGTIKDLETRVDNLEKTPQPQLIDWNSYNVSYFSYSADNVILLSSGIDITWFAIGDKVKLVQGGNTKYFYIVYIDNANRLLYLDAGTNYTYTNSAITYFATSKLTSPSGHPIKFTYSPTLYKGTDGSSFTMTTKSVYYTMQGRTVSTYMKFVEFNNFPSGQRVIVASLPFREDPTYATDTLFNSVMYMQNAFTSDGSKNILVLIERDLYGFTGPYRYILELDVLSGANFTTASGQVWDISATFNL